MKKYVVKITWTDGTVNYAYGNNGATIDNPELATAYDPVEGRGWVNAWNQAANVRIAKLVDYCDGMNKLVGELVAI